MTIFTYYTLSLHLYTCSYGHCVNHTLYIYIYIYIYIIYIYIYIYIYTWNIILFKILHCSDFQDSILWNFMSNCNENFIWYGGGCVELIYQIGNRSGDLD